MPVSTPRPLTRVGIFTGLAAALSLGAHVLGGGQRPGVAVTVALLVPTWWLARPLARRTLRGSTMVAWLGAMQLLWHAALAWVESGYAAPNVDGPSLRMLLAHVVAAAGLALLARHLERTLRCLSAAWHELMRPLRPRRSAYDALPGWPRTPAFAGPQICRPSDLPARSVLRRGPPA